MKLIFFLVSFCLITLRVYFSWSGRDRHNRGLSESDMVIKSDNFYEEIKWLGKFQLNEEENDFKSISPGGYFKFKRNELSVKAESNIKGEIEYTIYEGDNKLGMDKRGRQLIAQAIREMINWGFDGEQRMNRLYNKGGWRALLVEVDSMKTDQLKGMYLARLFKDSLSADSLSPVVEKIKSIGSDMDKAQFLEKISPTQLNHPQIAQIYFDVLNNIGSDMDKANVLRHAMDLDSISTDIIGRILKSSSRLGSDMDKANLYQDMIRKVLIKGPYYDSLLNLVSAIGSDIDKTNIYRAMLNEKTITESQWISLMDNTTHLGSDMDKANLFIDIAHKMLKTELTHAAYMKAAKSIGNDNDYGRVMRAMETDKIN